MLIPKDLVIEARQKFGANAAGIIAKDLNIKDYDNENLKGCCPFHNEDTPSFVWYEKGDYFKCFGCQKTYNIIDHYMNFDKLSYVDSVEKLFKESQTSFRFSEKNIKKKDYQYPKYEIDENEKSYDRTSVEKYLATRGISKNTLDKFDILSDKKGNITYNYRNTNGVLTMVRYRLGRIAEKTDSSKFWSQPNADTTPLLFGMNNTSPLSTLVLTEGELDALSVYEAGHQNSVSVPFGANNYSWIEENFDYLQQFETIIVWSDNDEPGIKMRKEVCSRLGSDKQKVLFVNLPLEIENEKIKDINQVLVKFGKEKVLEFINNAEEQKIEGILDLSEAEDFDLEKREGLYSGIKEIDDMIYKFFFGNVVSVTGFAGGGKSSLVNQLFINEALHQGYDVTVFSGELPSDMLRQWVEINMAGREHIEEHKNKFKRIIKIDTIKKMKDWYKGRINYYEAEDNHIDAVLGKAEETIRKKGVKVLVLDNLATLGLGEDDNNTYAKQKQAIVKIKNFANKFNILVVLVVHPRKPASGITSVQSGYEMSGSGDLFNLVQYNFSVKRITKKEKEGKKKRGGGWEIEPCLYDVRIEFFKNRITGQLGDCFLYFDYPSYRFYITPEQLWKRFSWDKNTLPLRTDDPNEKYREMPEEFKT